MPPRTSPTVDAPGDRADRPRPLPSERPVGRSAERAVREPRLLTPSMRLRRAVTLVLLSCVVPGSAQVLAGNRRLGRLLLRGWLAVVGLVLFAGLLLLLDRSFVLSLLTSPFVLVLMALGCFVAAVAVPLAIADAWRLARVGLLPPRARAAVSATAAVLVVTSCVVLVGGGRRLWAGADLIDDVFGHGTASEAADGRFNVLLLGGDAGPDRIGTRPDSMTLASIDAETGRTVLFSLPRNLEDIRFPDGSRAAKIRPQGWTCGDACLLNGLYTWGSDNRAAFPGVADPGAEVMKEAVEGVTGLKVNYYVLIDLKGFSQLVDALGGIRVTVNRPVPIGGGSSKVSGYLQPGTQTLDGYHALWFARSRHGANDYERMARQRCVMDAMVHQLDPRTVLTKFQDIAAAGKQVVSTDVPTGELGTFLDLAAKARSQRISSVQFVPPLVNPARPDFALIRAKVSAAVEASHHAPDGAAPSAVPSSAPAARPSATPGAPTGTPGPSAGSPTGASAGASPSAEASDISSICRPA